MRKIADIPMKRISANRLNTVYLFLATTVWKIIPVAGMRIWKRWKTLMSLAKIMASNKRTEIEDLHQVV